MNRTVKISSPANVSSKASPEAVERRLHLDSPRLIFGWFSLKETRCIFHKHSGNRRYEDYQKRLTESHQMKSFPVLRVHLRKQTFKIRSQIHPLFQPNVLPHFRLKTENVSVGNRISAGFSGEVGLLIVRSFSEPVRTEAALRLKVWNFSFRLSHLRFRKAEAVEGVSVRREVKGLG